jgi:hypothetical protein
VKKGEITVPPEPTAIRDRHDMVGEFFREIAVLVLVFSLIERLLKGRVLDSGACASLLE